MNNHRATPSYRSSDAKASGVAVVRVISGQSEAMAATLFYRMRTLAGVSSLEHTIAADVLSCSKVNIYTARNKQSKLFPAAWVKTCEYLNTPRSQCVQQH